MDDTHSASAGHDPRRLRLRRMQALALALLLAMLAGFLLAHAQGNRGVWAWVGAFCEAGTVGALADWFAVTALFRRPLGLPIPHTAIVPRNKARIGDSLGNFVRDHFLEPQALLDKLRTFDPASRLGQWLTQPERAAMLAGLMRGWVLQALDLLDEDAVRRNIQALVNERLRQWNAAGTAADVLDLLTRDGRHQALFDEALQRLARWLDEPAIKQRVAALMVGYARREWPRLVGTVDWVKPVDDIAGSLAERLAHALLDELDAVLSQPEHPLRQDYERWLGDYLQRLRHDPALAGRVEAIKQRLIDHPGMQDYVRDTWDQVRAALRADLMREDGAVAAHLRHALSGIGESLQRDAALRGALNQHLLAGAERIAGRIGEGAARHIAQTVKQWDDRRLIEQLELAFGRDLQFIRFNGTLVGGLIGLALHALTTLLAK